MKKYNQINNALGWLMFVVAAATYLLTIEPTASFWDCPEFISQGYKLEIGHPPGNPIFMLAARFAINFVSDPQYVSVAVNVMSAILSALTILLLFWTITHLVKKLVVKDGEEEGMTLVQYLLVMGSGVAGALAYTWSDTFWFSAVEAEVYAFSSFCTALVFWLILKWENRADEPNSDRYLILIAYVIGVSIAVHLLNLLCIPAIVLVFYYKKYSNTTVKGSLIALGVSFVIIALILYGLVPGFVKAAQVFELFCVNTIGLPYNSGVLIYTILDFAVFAWCLWELYRQQSPTRIKVSFLAAIVLSGMLFFGNGIAIPALLVIAFAIYLFKVCKRIPVRIFTLTALSILVIFIGYSSYALILIRSNSHTPINQNTPDNVFSLSTYLNREQYGDRPLLYGQTFNSGIVYQDNGNGGYSPVKSAGKDLYAKDVTSTHQGRDRYFMKGNDYKYKMNPELDMLFPRMYSGAHAKEYKEWVNLQGEVVNATTRLDREGNPTAYEPKVKPTFIENLQFFIDYQLNYMYWRYFMWNFAGRQNDNSAQGEITNGNWICGIPFIDNNRLGDQSLMPDDLGAGNKGHNVFYLLPLILGIIGLLWQAYAGKRGIEQFWVIFFLFFMTGIAIVIYLNQTPSQPRERDYAFAGSFYAYAIWIGMGVAGLWHLIMLFVKKLKKQAAADGDGRQQLAVACVAVLFGLFVPLQMVSQTWDDHDRSGRYTCRDFGQNYLMSLQDKGNPIIFTNGDNDTFPLWYDQDTEGIRTDARVCNLSYLQTDWYIDQMVRPAYDSPSLPITWPRLDYCSGTNEYIEVHPDAKQEVLNFYKEYPEQAKAQWGDNPFELKNVLKYWVRSRDKDSHFIPTDTLYVTIDKDAVRKSGMMMASDTIPDRMVISLKGKNALYKSDLMMLELIAQSNWVRPIYVAMTVGQENYMNLGDNFIQEGLANRITPFTTNKGNAKNFDTEKTYYNVMKRFKFGGLDKPGLYLDETVMRMCNTHRKLMSTLALHLIIEGKKDKAAKVLAYADKMMPAYNVPVNFMSGGLDYAAAYAEIGNKAKAKQMLGYVVKNAEQYANWYLSLSQDRFLMSQRDCMLQLYVLNQALEVANSFDPAEARRINGILNRVAQQYSARGGQMPQE